MDIYIFLFLFLSVCSLIPNKRKELFVFIFLFLTCISGVRGIDVGVDNRQYLQIFNAISAGSNYSIEPGWVFLNKLSSLLSNNYLYFLTIVSIFTLFPVFFVVNKCSPYIYLSIFIFYALHLYCGGFNIMRQYLGVSIVLLAYYNLKNGKNKKAFLIWLLSCSFHYSCFLAIIVFFHKKIQMSFNKAFILILVGFMFGSIINAQIVDFISFSEYTHIARFRENTILAATLTILIDILMLFIIKTMNKELLNSFWGKIFVLSIFVFNSTYTLHFSARIYSLFAISQILVLPMYIKSNTKLNKGITAGLIFIYVSTQFWRMYLANANSIIPYEMNIEELSNSIFRFLLFL